jgi:hypothetical protein
MGARRMMTMRAHIQRDMQVNKDPYGQPRIPDWQTLVAAEPCRTWFETERHVVDGDKTVAVENRKLIVPRDSTVLPGDRILDVKDRRGNVLFTGPALIEAVGVRKDHLVLSVAEVS